VSDTVREWSGPHLDDDIVELLVSELVTNAVVHARTDVDVRVRYDGRRLRVTIGDGDSQQPGRPRKNRARTTGRGLELVDTLAADWGVARTRNGKAVWFELDWVPRDDATVVGSARARR
jgi:anti-sigma regulatory factor (Ser/Thr protein kinase)